MLLILAQHDDPVAVAAAARWKDVPAAVLTARDLARPGWFLSNAPGAAFCGQLEGLPFGPSDLTGVVTRLAAISPAELAYVAPEDRQYVAAEGTAFLLAWLAQLPCPVLNRPSPNALTGPGWRQERWLQLAASLGIPVVPLHRSSEAGPAERDGPETVTVVGRRSVGESPLAPHALRLAAAAQTDLLEARFREGALSSVDLTPDIAQPSTAAAILEYFEERHP